jgi:hypothetical protein
MGFLLSTLSPDLQMAAPEYKDLSSSEYGIKSSLFRVK